MAEPPILTTEWEDAQYKIGNKIGKYANPELELRILAQRAQRQGKFVDEEVPDEDPNEGKTLEEIEQQLEDDYDEDRALEELRKRRLAELQQEAAKPKFGSLRRIDKGSYTEEVSRAPPGVWVVLLMQQPGHSGCQALRAVLEQAAVAHPLVKFAEILSTDCVAGFPDSELPFVVVYRDGQLQAQRTGLPPWGGQRLSLATVRRALLHVGVLTAADVDEGS
eukprot:RCo034941